MQRNKLVIFWIVSLFAALVARIAVAFYWDNKVRSEADSAAVLTDGSEANSDRAAFFFGDSDSYWNLGRALAFHRPYEFDPERHWQIFRTPGYPAVLAPLFWIFGENPPTLAARIQGALFGTLNVALVGLLAASFFAFPNTKGRWSWIPPLSGVFVAFDPTLVFQSVLILSEESFLSFSLLQNLCAINLAKKLGILPYPVRDMRVFAKKPPILEWTQPIPTAWLDVFLPAIALGVTTAATVYLRPSWYYFLPFAAVIAAAFRIWTGNAHELEDFYYTRKAIFFSWRKLAVAAVVTLSVALFALNPWIERNKRLTDRFIPTSLQMGASLYDGLNPNATGASDMRFVDEFRQAELNSPSGPTNVHFEVRLDRRMRNAALDWVKSNPGKAIKLAFVKVYRLWAPLPRERAFSKPILQTVLAVSFIPVFLLGIAGGVRSFRRRGAAWTLLVPALYITCLHSIFVSSIRYRTPVWYGFSILAAYWILSTVDQWREKRIN